MDVAQALTNILEVPSLPGLLNLPGPSALTYEYLLALVASVTYRSPTRAPVVPKAVALALSRLAQNVWWPTLSPDEIERRYIDDAEVPGDWDKFGIVPDEIEEHAITYLRRYRSACVCLSPFASRSLSAPLLCCFLGSRPRPASDRRGCAHPGDRGRDVAEGRGLGLWATA